MAKFQIVIRNSIHGELNKTVEFNEFTHAEAKDKSYYFFPKENSPFPVSRSKIRTQNANLSMPPRICAERNNKS